MPPAGLPQYWRTPDQAARQEYATVAIATLAVGMAGLTSNMGALLSYWIRFCAFFVMKDRVQKLAVFIFSFGPGQPIGAASKAFYRRKHTGHNPRCNLYLGTRGIRI
jgi:hypothetical protein